MRGLPVLVMCLVLSACGAQNPPPLTPGSSTPTSDTSTPSIPAPLPPSSAPLTTTPSRALEPGMTVRGTVSAGVELGCLVLNTGTAQYLLLGADPAIAVAGAEIEVTGRAEPGAMTTCQQGTPFTVQKTLRINP
ncbi:hypothetical protein SK803_07770 [Lentzea sp. BCCO 10_0856]|uniref:Uncharacterized protein n=1 Tax=Lentzea miocenica TaxID=3095431 RepID=A0ABU4SW27_9PSEU|nr:hypothetical protein [Lentzea sp. BCCO 10_0856]MDX8030105.1 hypothetical protein [Lentzea sp. BCCO 10_0856]